MKTYGNMKNMDLIELYQLLRMFQCVHPEDGQIGEVMEKVRHEYGRHNKGKVIDKAHNPRGAGRKRKYTEEEDERILKLYNEKKSMRKVSKAYGCSLGHVQDVIRRMEEAWLRVCKLIYIRHINMI